MTIRDFSFYNDLPNWFDETNYNCFCLYMQLHICIACQVQYNMTMVFTNVLLIHESYTVVFTIFLSKTLLWQ